MKRKKVLALILTLALVVSLMPVTAYADDAAELDISNGDITITETGYTQGTGTETPHDRSYKITQTGTNPVSNKIIIASGKIDLIISGLNIEAAKGPAIKVGTGATLNLTLDSENTLTGADGYAAISVAAGVWDDNSYVDGSQGHLLIDGIGTLTAQGGKAADSAEYGSGAGIGGDGYGYGNQDGGDFGIVEINGGTIISTPEPS